MPEPDLRRLRVDQVGSLLRPAGLKEVFTRYARHAAGEDELRRVQDAAVRGVVATQEAHGLPVVTDGEFRRIHFMESFAEVAGFEAWRRGWTDLLLSLAEAPTAGPARGLDPVRVVRRPVTERLRLLRNRPLEEYDFARRLTRRPVKVTVLGPERIAVGVDYERSVYAGIDELLADVVAVEREIVSGLVRAGCPYVQIDAPGYTAYVDPPSIEEMRVRGDDPTRGLARAIAADNAVIAGFPGVTFGVHVCRGNRQSMWHREGHYDAIAEWLFTGLAHDRLLLEYDTERAGGFEPLRFVPKGKTVVLGLITTKAGRVEGVDELRRRIDQAARHVPLEQLALSPQCGFASNIAGNALEEADQWRKLDVMLETAARVWG